MKNIDKILISLPYGQPIMKKDIVDKSNIVKSTAGIYLKKLVENALIEKLSYGEYLITEKGKEKAEIIKSKYSSELTKFEDCIVEKIQKPTISMKIYA